MEHTGIFQISEVALCSASVKEEDVYTLTDEGQAGDNLTYKLYNDGLLVFEGFGDMWNFRVAWDNDDTRQAPPWADENGNNPVSAIQFSDQMTSIGEHAFHDAVRLAGDLELPDSIKRIGEGAFLNTSLNGIKLSENLEYIGEEAFGMAPLTGDLVIPNKVTHIGDGAFSYVWIPIQTDEYGREVEGTDYVPVRGTLEGKLTLGTSVQYIGSNAFRGQPFSGDLVIPDSVTDIGNNAFNSFVWGEWRPFNEDGNPDMYSVGAFDGGSLVIGDGINHIDRSMFNGCAFRGNLTIGDSVEEIDDNMFDGQGFEGELKLGNSIWKIGRAAFAGNRFTGSLTIPNSVTEIGDEAFATGGRGYSDEEYDHEWDGHYNEYGEWIQDPPEQRWHGDGAPILGSFTGKLILGNQVQYIGHSAFFGQPFTGSLTIPDSVTFIGNDAFGGEVWSGDMADITFLEEDGRRVASRWKGTLVNAFAGGSLTIGKNVTNIGHSAFYGTGFTGTLTLKEHENPVMDDENPVGLRWIWDGAFQGVPFTGDLIIPKSVVTIGSNAFSSAWKEYTEIYDHVNDGWWDENDFHSNPLRERMHTDNAPVKGTMTGKLVLSENLFEIGNNAFRGQPFTGSLVIPDSVRWIGNDAFNSEYWDGKMSSIEFHYDEENNLTDTNWKAETVRAFSSANQSEKTSLTVGKNVIRIGHHAFYRTGFTGTLTLNEHKNFVVSDKDEEMVGLRWIEDGAFEDVPFTGSLDIPDSVVLIGDSAFGSGWYEYTEAYDHVWEGWWDDNGVFNQNSLRDRMHRDSVPMKGTFNGTLHLSEALEELRNNAFRGQPFTGSLVIPDGVTWIGNDAFNANVWSGDPADLHVEKDENGSIVNAWWDETSLRSFSGSLTIGKNVVELNNSMFRGTGFTGQLILKQHENYKLNDKEPVGLRWIRDNTFEGIPFTGDLVIPDSVAMIGDRAFASEWKDFGEPYDHYWETTWWDDENKQYVERTPEERIWSDGQRVLGTINGKLTLGKNLDSIGHEAFMGQPFTGGLTIPNSVTHIGDRAFKGDVWDDKKEGSAYRFYDEKGRICGTYFETVRTNAFAPADGSGKTNLVIPDSVTYLGNEAFSATGFNGTLTLGNGLTTIRNSAFWGVPFTGTLTLPENLESIEDGAFSGAKFTGNLVIPDKVWYIGGGAFESGWIEYQKPYDHINDGHHDNEGNWIQNEAHQRWHGDSAPILGTFNGTLTLGNSVREIGWDAFHGQPFTGSLVIPDTVMFIGGGAFNGSYWDGDMAGIHYNKDENGKITGTWWDEQYTRAFGPANPSEKTSLTVGMNVTSIDNGLFYGTGFNGTLTLNKHPNPVMDDEHPVGLRWINDGAFEGVPFTGNLVIPDSVVSIGRNAFSAAWKEYSPEDYDHLGDGWWDENDVWHQAPAEERMHGDGAPVKGTFDGTLTLSKNLDHIGDNAFRCQPFTGSLTIPDSVTWIGNDAFNAFAWDETAPHEVEDETPDGVKWTRLDINCVPVGAFTDDLYIGTGLEEINDNVFNGTGFEGNLTVGVHRIRHRQFSGDRVQFKGDLTILDSVKVMENHAFREAPFEGKLTLGNGLTKIPDGAFCDTRFTGTLTIPYGITEIGPEAFRAVPFTGDLVIPDSVTEIGDAAFCAPMKFWGEEYDHFWDTMTWDWDEERGIDYQRERTEEERWWTDGAYVRGTFDGTLTLSKNLTRIGWDAFNCQPFKGPLVLPDGLKEICGGAFCGFAWDGENAKYWYDEHGRIHGTEFTIVNIGSFAVEDGVSNLVIPDSVTFLGGNAFGGTGFNGTLTIGTGIDKIRGETFREVPFSGSLTVPGNVKDIEDAAFAETGFTGTLKLEEGIETIGDSAFEGATFTGDLTIPDSVTTIGRSAFCAKWEIFTPVYDHEWETYWDEESEEELPRDPKSRMREDGTPVKGTFDGKLKLGKNLTFIGENAFRCQPFTGDLIIPDSVTKIESGAFQGWAWDGDLSTVTKSYDEEGHFRGYDFVGFPVNAFENGTITLGNQVSELGDCAFSDTGVESVNILGPVTNWGNWVFGNCQYLSSAYFAHNVPNVPGDRAVFGDSDQMADQGFVIFYNENTDWPEEAKDDGKWNGYNVLSEGSKKCAGDGKLIGDVDGNDKINKADLLILSRYLAGWEGYDKMIESMDAADIDRVNGVTARDRMILARYLAHPSEYRQYFWDDSQP
jgi:hypothetical protein